eukprot:250223-Pleurochrysis_carterae.AAC.2
MRPRRKQDAAPRAASGYNVLRQVRRVHLQASREMIKVEHLRRAVDGLQQQFVALRGHESFLPRCKFPMPHDLFHCLIASSALSKAPLLRASLLDTMCVLYSVAFVRPKSLKTCRSVRRGLLVHRSCECLIGRVSTKHPTPQQLEALSVGGRCKISPRQSKCDATGEVWGNRPIALAYVDVPGNAAKALAHLELAFPVEENERESVILLLTAENANPLMPSHPSQQPYRILAP